MIENQGHSLKNFQYDNFQYETLITLTESIIENIEVSLLIEFIKKTTIKRERII